MGRLLLGTCLLYLVNPVFAANLPPISPPVSPSTVVNMIEMNKPDDIGQINISLDDKAYVYSGRPDYDNDGSTSDGFTQLYIKYFNNPTHTQLTSTMASHAEPHLSPTSDMANNKYTIAFIHIENDENHLGIYKQDGTTSTTTIIDEYEKPDGRAENFSVVGNFNSEGNSLAWSPDGTKLAVAINLDGWTSPRYAIFVKRISPIRGMERNPYPVSMAISTSPGNLVWSSDQKSIYFSATLNTADYTSCTGIFRQKIEGTLVEYSSNCTYNYSPFMVTSDGKYLLAVREDTAKVYSRDSSNSIEYKEPIIQINVDTGEMTTFLDGNFESIQETQYSNYAIVSQAGNLYTLNLTTKELTNITDIASGDYALDDEFSIGTNKGIYLSENVEPNGTELEKDVVTVFSFSVGDDANTTPVLSQSESSSGSSTDTSVVATDCPTTDTTSSATTPSSVTDTTTIADANDGTAVIPAGTSTNTPQTETEVTGDGSTQENLDANSNQSCGCFMASGSPVQSMLDLMPFLLFLPFVRFHQHRLK